mgnify:CR=1 FL=1
MSKESLVRPSRIYTYIIMNIILELKTPYNLISEVFNIVIKQSSFIIIFLFIRRRNNII